jgi:hypothetical protein
MGLKISGRANSPRTATEANANLTDGPLGNTLKDLSKLLSEGTEPGETRYRSGDYCVDLNEKCDSIFDQHEIWDRPTAFLDSAKDQTLRPRATPRVTRGVAKEQGPAVGDKCFS